MAVFVRSSGLNSLLAGVIVFALLCPSAVRGEAFSFALIGTESSDALVAMWNPLLEDMSKEVGIAITPQAYPDYSGAVWALKANKAKLAWLGNKAALQAVEQAQCEVAFLCLEADGASGYTGQLIVRADSSFMTWDDVLKSASSLTFALGDPNSTSGYVIPSYYLFAAKGIVPDKTFKRVVRGSHEANFLSVALGLTDVATSNSFDMRRLNVKHPKQFPLVRVIWNSPPFPSDPLVWRKDLPESQKNVIRTFLLQYGQPGTNKDEARLEHERSVLKGMGRSGFRESDDSQLLQTRKLELFTLKEQVLADPELNNGIRKEKLREIDQRIEALQKSSENQPQ